MSVGFFFDGTNNHKDRDFPSRHSNVVGLLHVFTEKPELGIQRFYYEGCGTDFDFAGRYERHVSVVGRDGRTVVRERTGYSEDESRLNQAFGLKIDKRLEKAIFEFEYFVEEWRAQRRVDEINVSAFGFSRGAATARAFVHWLAALSKVTVSGNKLAYDGIPLRFRFLGLFDTVESVGLPGRNTQAELIKTSIPGYVEKCVHTVAAHELRDAFPVTLISTRGAGGRRVQVASPGVHSDIGGGYADHTQGRRAHLARINLLQMLDHARGAGLPMLSLAEMRQADGDRWQTTFRHSFDVPAEALTAFSDYMRHVDTPSGPLSDVFHSHMKWYWQWIDSGLAAEDAGQKFGHHWRDAPRAPGSDARRKELAAMSSVLQQSARTEVGKGRGSLTGTPAKAPQRGTIPPAVEHLLENYVHDSQVGFRLVGTLQVDFSKIDYYAIREVRRPGP